MILLFYFFIFDSITKSWLSLPNWAGNLAKRKGINKLPATSRQKNQTVTLNTKLHLDLTKPGRPVCENQTVLSA